jgi:hypothetical protein
MSGMAAEKVSDLVPGERRVCIKLLEGRWGLRAAIFILEFCDAYRGSPFAGVPIPEQYAAEGQEIEGAIRRSLREAEEKQVSGAGTTPFLLQRIQQLTGGKSLAANIHLIKNNATVGSQIACALAQAT